MVVTESEEKQASQELEKLEAVFGVHGGVSILSLLLYPVESLQSKDIIWND